MPTAHDRLTREMFAELTAIVEIVRLDRDDPAALRSQMLTVAGRLIDLLAVAATVLGAGQ